MQQVEPGPVTISSLEFENVKRVKAVALTPSRTGLTVIGGRNAQGKTSVLDSICWALGGGKYRPVDARRDGSASDPRLHVELSNGVVVERKGKGGALKVTDPSGRMAGQALLDSFVEQFALDLPRFLNASDKDKALTLLRIVGVEDELEELDRREAVLVQERLTTGQVERQRRGAVETMPYYPEAPVEPVDVGELAERQREGVERNAENQRARDGLESAEREHGRTGDDLAAAVARVEELRGRFDAEESELARMRESVAALVDVDVSGVADEIEAAQAANAKRAANEAKHAAKKEADKLAEEYEEIDRKITKVRAERVELLAGADMPLPGMSVEGGNLVYGGHRWSDMSGSEQMKVATAIVRKINPACGFVLVDKLEQMDVETLAEFAAWCEAEGLQVIGTRVSTGDECSVVIEDGMVGRIAQPQPTEECAASDAVEQTLRPLVPGVEEMRDVPPLSFAVADGRAF